jgi:hypothetical protein
MKYKTRINILRVIFFVALALLVYFAVYFKSLADYLSLVKTLILFGLVISLIPFLKFKFYKKDHDSIIKFAHIIIGTLAGVFLAIYVNQTEAKKEKMDEVENILQSTKGNVFASYRLSAYVIGNATDTNEERSYKKAPLHYIVFPISLTEILRMEIVLMRISQRTLERLSATNSIITTFHGYLKDKNIKYDDFKKIGSLYCKYLDISFHLFKYEIEHMKGEISDDSLRIKDARIFPEYEL